MEMLIRITRNFSPMSLLPTWSKITKGFYTVGRALDKFLGTTGISIQLCIFLVGVFVSIPSATALIEGATHTFFALWLLGGLVILIVLMLTAVEAYQDLISADVPVPRLGANLRTFVARRCSRARTMPLG
jgi:hypothetical protein